MNWNQPICERCFADRSPGRVPVRLATRAATVETCSYCGRETAEGIYVRERPSNVRFPQPEEEP